MVLLVLKAGRFEAETDGSVMGGGGVEGTLLRALLDPDRIDTGNEVL
jgi:hypothetical protein